MSVGRRPTVGKLTVPYVVNEHLDPIRFTELDPDHVERCAKHRRCGICGSRIHGGRPMAFIGPDDGRTCFGDAWMHPECAQLAMVQCPFLRGDRGYREGPANELDAEYLARYEAGMVLRIAMDGRSHRDGLGHWHFEAIGPLEPMA